MDSIVAAAIITISLHLPVVEVLVAAAGPEAAAWPSAGYGCSPSPVIIENRAQC